MNSLDWVTEFPIPVMVCDLRGIVLEMNVRAAANYQKYGGMQLIGKSLMDCHPEPARSKLQCLLENGGHNVYTIEKNGIRKLICQSPWYQSGLRLGMVEIAIEFPADLPHFVRT